MTAIEPLPSPEPYCPRPAVCCFPAERLEPGEQMDHHADPDSVRDLVITWAWWLTLLIACPVVVVLAYGVLAW